MAETNCTPLAPSAGCSITGLNLKSNGKRLPKDSGGGHEFVTELPETGDDGVEYILFTDVSDCSTYQGTYVFNSECNSWVATSGTGGGALDAYTFAKTSTGWTASKNGTVIFTYVDKDTLDTYQTTANGFDILRDGSIIFSYSVSIPDVPEYTASKTDTGWVLKKDGTTIFTYTDVNDEYTIEATDDGWVFKENGTTKFTYTEPEDTPSDGTYATSSTLTTVIGGTTSVLASTVSGFAVADVVIGETLIYDASGSLGRVTAVSGNTLTVETVTVSPSTRSGTRLGAVDLYTDLPATVTAATTLGWQTPIAGDFAYVREDSTHDDHLTEWVITSIDNSGNITWAYSHTLNAGNYVVDILTSDGTLIPKNADGTVTLPADADTTYDFETVTDGSGNVTGWRVKNHDTGTVLYTYTDQNDNDNTEYDFEDVTSGGVTTGWRVKNKATGTVLFTHTDIGDTTYDFETVTSGGNVIGWRVKDGDTGTALFTYNDLNDPSDGSYSTSDTLDDTIGNTTTVAVTTVSGLTVTDVVDGETLIYDGDGTLGVVTSHTTTDLVVTTMTLSGSGDASSFIYETTETLDETIDTVNTVAFSTLTAKDSTATPTINDIIVGKTIVYDAEGTAGVVTGVGSTTVNVTTMTATLYRGMAVEDEEETPVGNIIAFMGNNVPAHYLYCDGSTYNIADYPELAEHFTTEFGSVNYFGGDGTTTFAVPDLRGEFLRGTGENGHSGQGDGSNVGDHQDEGLPNITGATAATTRLFGQSVAGTQGTGAVRVSASNVSGTNGNAFGNSGVLSDTVGVVAGLTINAAYSNSIYGNSTHNTPTNTSVKFCIKYESTMQVIENIIGADSVYSTDEQLVGSYLGKPLYKMTLTGTTPSSTTTQLEETRLGLASEIDSIVKYEGYVVSANAGWQIQVNSNWSYNANSIVFLNLNPNGYYRGGSMITTGGIGMYWNNTSTDYQRQPYQVTVYYTKTADTAGSAPNKNSLLLSRPDLWDVGKEYDFGGGLYGIRVSGSVTLTANSQYNLNVVNVGSAGKFVNCGGYWQASISSSNPYKYPLVAMWGANPVTNIQVTCPWISDNDHNLKVAFMATQGQEGSHAYDFWFTYTK